MKKHLGNIVSFTSIIIVIFAIQKEDINFIIFAIFIAAILDMFDGKLARKYGNNTKYEKIFGELTDSLCDIFNFGIAPSLILATITFETLLFPLNIAVILFIISGIFRLARFSASKTDKVVKYYQGVPITVAGPIITFSYLVCNDQGIITILYLIMSYLMISNIKIKKL